MAAILWLQFTITCRVDGGDVGEAREGLEQHVGSWGPYRLPGTQGARGRGLSGDGLTASLLQLLTAYYYTYTYYCVPMRWCMVTKGSALRCSTRLTW
eukprot:scaffold4324_cov57-Phaeocystis_antarctica.AAC.3